MLILKSFAVLHVLAAMFNDCIIKTISSGAGSREEQDGSKHSFIGQTTAELQAILQVYVMKNMEKKGKPKILASLKKAAFPASFADKDHQNRNFMVSNTIVILLLLLELENFFSRHTLWSQLFGLCDLGAQKRNAKKLAYAG